MGTKQQKKLRRLAMQRLQRECESNSDWWTWGPFQKLNYRSSKLMSFEMNEGGVYVNGPAKQTRNRLNKLSARAWDGWTSDFATLLLISFEATRHINRIARRDPAFVKKFAYLLGAWPVICQNKGKLDPHQCRLLDEIGIARPKEFRVGANQAMGKDKADLRDAEFIFLWMQDHWQRRHLLGEDSGSSVVMLFLKDRIWPKWYRKRRTEVSNKLRKAPVERQHAINDALAMACELPTSSNPQNHGKWSEVAERIYRALMSGGERFASQRAGNTKDDKILTTKMPPSLFRKNFMSILRGRPGAGRPRATKA